MKGLRFYLALYSAKLAVKALKILHRNGSHNPGVLALKICPDFLKRMDMPKTIIGITGTNGKTTTANLVLDILEKNGYHPVSNRTGSNILGGVVTTLISAINLKGETVKNLAVLELDERSSRLIYPYLHPTYLLVNNLFQDSFKRNAHPEFIFDILNENIPASSTLILNGDDLISARLAPDNKRVYFGMDPQEGEMLNQENLIQDLRVCPYCGAPLEYDFRRYHHIGQAHCTRCAFASPSLDYRVKKAVIGGTVSMDCKGEPFEVRMVGQNVHDAYNLAAAVALLSEFGLTREQLKSSFESLEIIKSRLSIEKAGGKTFIYTVAKGQNPVACSRIFDKIRQYEGRKAVVLMVDDHGDALETSENIAWLYDVDFEFLNQPDIAQIVCSGVRCLDHKVRLMLAGVPEEKITCVDKEADAADAVRLDEVDTVFFLYDVYTVVHANTAREALRKRFGTN